MPSEFKGSQGFYSIKDMNMGSYSTISPNTRDSTKFWSNLKGKGDKSYDDFSQLIDLTCLSIVRIYMS